MNKNFAMMVLQMVSHTQAEACPPPCVNTTNKLQPFGHRRGKKTSTRPIRFAQPVEPVLPLLRAQLRKWSGRLDSNQRSPEPHSRSAEGKYRGKFVPFVACGFLSL